MKHNFEQRKQNRIDHAKEQAEKNEQKSDALFNQAKQMASFIPFGQPILVGHHSEKRDRNYRNSIHNTFGKSFEAADKARYYEGKAESIESNDAIFSDDPQAVEKLKAKIASLQANQAFMKAANKCLKKKDKEAFLKLPHATPALWEEISTPDVMHCTGFAHYSLQNNNTNINRLKKCLQQLEKISQLTTTEQTIKDVRIVANAAANRVQLFFEGKPAEEVRQQLKQNGFRWCRSEMAWQRHLTPVALRIAQQIAQTL